MRFPLVAFTGFAGAGKDEAAKPLIEAGYKRVAFGDIIKGQCDALIRQHFGFSAFTEVREEKAKIRRTLEAFGEDNYDNIFKEFFRYLTPPAANTRLCRLKEAEEWRKRGGILVEITRPGVGPETEWSEQVNRALRDHGMISFSISNPSTVEKLHEHIRYAIL